MPDSDTDCPPTQVGTDKHQHGRHHSARSQARLCMDLTAVHHVGGALVSRVAQEETLGTRLVPLPKLSENVALGTTLGQ